MCGITGYWNLRTQEPIDRDRLTRMNDVMIPRGPDDSGTFVDGAFGMAARRLSIIDLDGGHQPLANEDGSIWIAYNGEVYNFPELREKLLARGHRFQTRTDTETLVHLYEDRGAKLVDELNGMFAFAIFDRTSRTLFIARDRLGVKPLFYSFRNGRFVFGSDLKSFFHADPSLRDELDPDAVHHYLSFNYIPAPHTILKHVRVLPPGHHLTLTASGTLTIAPYWDVVYAPDETRSDAELEEELSALLADAVEKRLIADVPVGVLLSGGLDSSSVARFMRDVHTTSVKTFSVHFAEESYSEARYAREVATLLGTDHYEVEVGAPSEALLRQIAIDAGQPYADSSMIPLHAVCGLAREHVKVVLSGDGGDEVLSGYATYTAYQLAALYRRLPRFVTRGVIRPLVNRLPVSEKKISLSYKAKRFVRGAELAPELAHYEFKVLFDEAQKARLYAPGFRNGGAVAASYDVFERIYRSSPESADVLNQLLKVDTKIYLPDDILVKVDRMSMAHSLEARTPFLDYRLVEFAGKLPLRLKQTHREGKVLLKRAMADRLPPGIVRRRKAGFNVPAAAWLRGPLREVAAEYLGEAAIRESGVFDARVIRTIWGEHLDAKCDWSREIFGLLMFQLWHRHVYKDAFVGVCV